MHTAAPVSHPLSRLWRRFTLTLEMIRFEHSVFALPFALASALLAWRETAMPAPLLWPKLGWILACMVTARSAAMAFNRILDAEIDARNPRTRNRHLPAGLLSRSFAWSFTIVCSLLFVLSAAQLNRLCLLLSPLALGVVFFYSWTKRFTSLSHLVLGFSLGIAPAAAWIAMTGSLDPRILWLTLAVTLWTAGFDVIYSCQDFEFDRREGLFSLPARLGIARALHAARLFHVLMLAALVLLARSFAVGFAAWTGLAVTALLLLWEHRLVRADDLSRVDAAFFTVNGWIGVLFLGFWAADILLRPLGA
ncbi:MAG: 4-hydroxybenzoate octaprenyltransferase [Bryobacteraceae bacterium]|nr:MAG: 4-hydroxybenzoate octaprenyltransferase [Bryobacteraceae bacterium]